MSREKHVSSAILFSAVCILSLVAGCGEKASSPGGEIPSSDSAAPATSLSADQKSAHFDAVSPHLDLGGVLYTYLDVDGDLKELATTMGDFIATMEGVPGPADEIPEFLTESVGLATMVEEIGLHDLKAVGASSFQNGDQFRNRFFLHLPNGRTGFFGMMGGEAQTFLSHQLAPAGVDLVLEREFNLEAGLRTVMKVMEHFPDAAAEILMALKQPMIPGSQLTMEEFIGKIDTRIFLALRIDPEEKMVLPDAPPNLPLVEVAVGLEGMGWLFEEMKSSMPIDPNKGFEVEIEEDHDLIIVPDSMQNPKLRPAIYHDKKRDLLLVASHRGFLDECLGDGPKVTGDVEFKSAMEGLPEKGNGLSYLTPDVMKTIRGLIESTMAGAGAPPEAKSAMVFLDLWLPEIEAAEGGISANLDNGIVFASNSRESHKSSLMSTANPTLVAILASVGMPAFTTMNQNAKLVKGSADVRQLLLGCRVYAVDNEGRFPPNLEVLGTEGYIDQPEMLVWVHPDTGKSVPYVYNAGLTDSSPGNLILIAAPEPYGSSDKRAVGHVDGHVELIREYEYQLKRDKNADQIKIELEKLNQQKAPPEAAPQQPSPKPQVN